MSSQLNASSLIINFSITQLFVGGIGSVIELIRMFTMNFLTKYVLSTEHIHKYGMYIQPAITAILLLSIGIFLSYAIKWWSNDDDMETGITNILIFWILFSILASMLFFFIWYCYRLSKISKDFNKLNKAIE